MSAILESLSHDALDLPAEERVILAYRLLTSVESKAEPDSEAAWEAEITERIARYDAGQTQAVSAGEVFASLREIAPD
jgi:putative addiction module component (TIGR02574 family)